MTRRGEEAKLKLRSVEPPRCILLSDMLLLQKISMRYFECYYVCSLSICLLSCLFLMCIRNFLLRSVAYQIHFAGISITMHEVWKVYPTEDWEEDYSIYSCQKLCAETLTQTATRQLHVGLIGT